MPTSVLIIEFCQCARSEINKNFPANVYCPAKNNLGRPIPSVYLIEFTLIVEERRASNPHLQMSLPSNVSFSSLTWKLTLPPIILPINSTIHVNRSERILFIIWGDIAYFSESQGPKQQKMKRLPLLLFTTEWFFAVSNWGFNMTDCYNYKLSSMPCY